MKVLTFGAVWCSGCLVMKPIWEEIIKENDWIEREYIDIDEKPEIAKKYDIEEIPVFVFLDKDGKEIERMEGEFPKEELVTKINELKDK